jgi:hypothetical protein
MIQAILDELRIIKMNFADPSRVRRCDELCEAISLILDLDMERATARNDIATMQAIVTQYGHLLQAKKAFDVPTLETTLDILKRVAVAKWN